MKPNIISCLAITLLFTTTTFGEALLSNVPSTKILTGKVVNKYSDSNGNDAFSLLLQSSSSSKPGEYRALEFCIENGDEATREAEMLQRGLVSADVTSASEVLSQSNESQTQVRVIVYDNGHPLSGKCILGFFNQ